MNKKKKHKQAPRDKEFEVNLTPRGVVLQGMTYLRDQLHMKVKSFIDISAGAGVYCSVVREVWPCAQITAVEPREEQEVVLKKLGVIDEILIRPFDPRDFKKYQFDLAGSNVPFSKTKYWLEQVYDWPLSNAFLILDKTQGFQRSKEGVRLLQRCVPEEELRIAQGIRFRSEPGTDGICYSHWLWHTRTPKPASEFPSWASTQLPCLPVEDRKP